MDLIDYIRRLSREERTAHVDLQTPCTFDRHKNYIRDVLCDYLGLPLQRDIRVRTCHLCSNHTGTEKVCTNPQHLYFGSATEDAFDRPVEKRSRSFTAAHQHKASVAGNKKRWATNRSAWWSSPDGKEELFTAEAPEGWVPGRYRTRSYSPQQAKKAKNLKSRGCTLRQISDELGLSPWTVRRMVNS